MHSPKWVAHWDSTPEHAREYIDEAGVDDDAAGHDRWGSGVEDGPFAAAGKGDDAHNQMEEHPLGVQR